MTFRRIRPIPGLALLALLAGCVGSMPGGDDALYSLPSAPPPPFAPPVSESYIIQRAPVVVPSYTYAPAEIFEVTVAENARREAEAQRMALAQLQQQINTRRVETAVPTLGVLVPDDSRSDNSRPYESRIDREATARAEARAAAAEAEAAALAAELAEARRAVAQAEAAALEAESAAQRAVRERVAQLAAERASGLPSPRSRAERAPDRANPAVPPRRTPGRFATFSAPAPAPSFSGPSPAAPRTVAPAPAPAPRPVVERAPIPGLKPYILARSALPSAKPRRAPPARTFGIGTPSPLSSPATASIAPLDVSIPREPGDLSTRFFPTPGKPSTLGTDRDSQLDLASIDAVPYGVGSQVREAVDSGAATAEWTDAVALIENGEVEALAIMADADLVLTLCSGREITTTPPDLAAAATLTAPQIICGRNKPLELR